ncbi:MAG TPA: hypothetical protein PK992_20530 [Planctomycetaceae bacterium]|nr:hypothetical protein [Planctomycetaceae bacterium]
MNTATSDSSEKPNRAVPRWAAITLLVAALQCLIWGVFIILWPVKSSLVYGFAQPPVELFLWQGTGLVIVLFGIGYVIASTDPLQHWLIVLIGLLGKSLGPIGMIWSVYHGQVSSRVLYLIPINDLIWLIPFGLILQRVRRSCM